MTAFFLQAAAEVNPTAAFMQLILPLVAVFVVFYFIILRPQKKKEKEVARMRSNLEIGDEVITIGGIIGRVVNFKDEDDVIIETGADRSKIRIKRWAIQSCETMHDA